MYEVGKWYKTKESIYCYTDENCMFTQNKWVISENSSFLILQIKCSYRMFGGTLACVVKIFQFGKINYAVLLQSKLGLSIVEHDI